LPPPPPLPPSPSLPRRRRSGGGAIWSAPATTGAQGSRRRTTAVTTLVRFGRRPGWLSVPREEDNQVLLASALCGGGLRPVEGPRRERRRGGRGWTRRYGWTSRWWSSRS